MRRWLGIGAVLAALVAALGYVLGPEWTDLAPGADERDTRTWEDAATRPPPVSALLGAPLPPARGNLFIRGTVLGRDGRPVAGAVVVATAPVPGETLSELPAPCEDEREKKLPQCDCDKGLHQLVEKVAERQGEAPPHARTTSDAEGRFSLEGLEAGTYALWADGPFGTLLHLDVPAGSEGLELRVGPGMTLSGRIRDEDGNPAAGALVTALLVEHSRFFDTLADDRGNWRLGPLPMGSYHLVVTLAGFLPEHTKVREDPTEELEVMLYRPLRLTGQVLREGHPVAGARVHAQGRKQERDTTADAQGRFSLEDLRPNIYQLIATHAGMDTVRSIWVGPGMDIQNVLLELGTDARVTGTVRDPAGNPIADASIWTELDSRSLDNPTLNARTAADGTYSLGPLPLGKYQLQAVASRYRVSSSLVNVPKAGLQAQDFTLEPSLLIEGRVLNAAGQPLPGVKLEWRAETGEARGAWRNSTSGEDGTFVLKALEPVSHRLWARHEDFLPTAQTVQAPASGVQVVLRAGARVEGEVVDEKELPVPQARVQLLSVEEPGEDGLDSSRETRTDERGRFTLQGLEPGGYRVSAWSGTGAEARTNTRSLAVSGTETGRVRLQFPVGLSLSGLVVDGAGKPVPEATLHLSTEELDDPEQAIDFQEWQGKPRTGADGRFQVRHLAAGSYRLYASARGHDFDQAMNGLGDAEHDPGIKVRAGATGVRIVLEKLARIRGRVVRPDGTPVTRFLIDHRMVADSQGAFDLPITRSGKKTLAFTAPGLTGTTRELSLTQGVDAELGEVVLTQSREVRGRVVDAETGAPVAGAEVAVDDDPSALERKLQHRNGEVRTAWDGTFTLPDVEERALTLGVEHPDYKQARVALAARQGMVTVALEVGATLKGEVHLANRRRFEVIVWSPGGTASKARVVGTEYERRGLPAGTYVVFIQTREAGAHHHSIRDVPPRQVDIPASGVVVLDFDETPANATLRLRLTGAPVPRARFYLVAGSLPIPDSPRAYERLQYLDFARGDRAAGVFHGLSAGHYTLFVKAPVEDGTWWHREELELPGKGEVSRDISPQWVRVPDSTLRALDD
ncbi:carboxypeptidase regulatory-like domain-containing protein [Archangium violaceum]|uniref:carboxypeptidase regulatory-like domain-containing protein n=1 Tax=Archangium violaceum TaxID=83451 RepID=UPI002B2F0E36|nr:carboxypeptidase regulatory-like domain-containing protein [Archangium gephyra]